MNRAETRSVFSKRLRQVMDDRGLKPRDVAKHLKIGAESVRKWLRAQCEPETHRYEPLAQLFGVSVGWLQFGELSCEIKIDKPSIRTVPLVALNGFVRMDDKVVSGTPVSDKAYGFVMSGESMEPLIKDRWICIVDPEVQPKHGDIVLFDRDGHGICRRLLQDGGEWILKPENERYDLIKNIPFDKIKGTVVSATINFK